METTATILHADLDAFIHGCWDLGGSTVYVGYYVGRNGRERENVNNSVSLGGAVRAFAYAAG